MRTIIALVLSAVACRAAIDPFFYIPSNLCAGPAGDLAVETFGEFLLVVKKCNTGSPGGTVSFDAYSFGVAASGALTAVDHIRLEWYRDDPNITFDVAKLADKPGPFFSGMVGVFRASWGEAKLFFVATNGTLSVGQNTLESLFLPGAAYDVVPDKWVFYHMGPVPAPDGSSPCFFQICGGYFCTSCAYDQTNKFPATLWNAQSLNYTGDAYYFRNDEFSNNLVTWGWQTGTIRTRPSAMGNHTAGTWWLNKPQDLVMMMFGFDTASEAQVYNAMTGEFGIVVPLVPNIQNLRVKDTCAYLTAGTATAVSQFKLPTSLWGPPSSLLATRTLSAPVLGVYPSMTEDVIYVLNSTHIGYAEVTCP